MCVNYVHYYPSTKLEVTRSAIIKKISGEDEINIIPQVCKSAISDDALRTYFRYLREWESQGTSADKGISDNYKSIEWTKVRVAALHDLYEVAPLGK